jgi:hypothetical protein
MKDSYDSGDYPHKREIDSARRGTSDSHKHGRWDQGADRKRDF